MRIKKIERFPETENCFWMKIDTTLLNFEKIPLRIVSFKNKFIEWKAFFIA